MKNLSKSIVALLFSIIIMASCGQASNSSNVTNDSIANNDSVEKEKRVLPSEIKVMMMGDIMPGTQHPFNNRNAYLTNDDGKSLFNSVIPIIKEGDFIVGNLEGTFVDRSSSNDKHVNPSSQYVFMIPTRYAKLFKDAGFTALSVINNHANDMKNLGIESTRKTLKEIGMPYSGFKADGGYTIIDKDSVRYALCAFATSANGNHIDDIENSKKIVAEAKTKADIVIVSFHGGNEGKNARHVPKKREFFRSGASRGDVYKFARACVDAGADIVFGHSPHVCRAMEIYNGHIIAYSLGNFCTPYRMNVSGISGYAPLLEVTVDSEGKFVKGKIHSFRQAKGRGPALDPTNAAAKEIRTLSKEDMPQTYPQISDNGEISLRK
ncbi:MAG: CapA family protein [Muribaculaceae bacterium]|nr:CapA family protein [Muribaculaceae bacterium]